MIVEDDAAISDLLSRTLGRFYDVRVVRDGGQVLQNVDQFRPDLVLLDVNLPNKDGFSIARAMKANASLSKIPIVFLTAQDGSTDVVKGIQVGAKHYLTKPFKIDDLLKKVQRLLPS